MVEVLKITPTDLEKTVIDTANSMIELGVIKRSKKSKSKTDSVAGGDAADPAAVVEQVAGDAGQLILSLLTPTPILSATLLLNF